jgi:two-component system sensor histidine kinase UhpB
MSAGKPERSRAATEAETLRFALQAAGVGTWDWDVTSDVVTSSDELGPIFGLPPGSGHPTYRSFLDAVHPDDRARVDAAVQAALGEGAEYALEFRIVWPDGTVHWVANKGTLYRDRAGRPVRLTGIAMDVTERNQVEERLRRSQQLLRTLAAREQERLELERTRMAREIHDVLGQSLTALKLDLAAVHKALPRPQAPVRRRLAAMSKLVDATIKAVRRLSTELRPAILDDLGLAAAVEWLAQDFAERTGLACQAHVSLDGDPPGRETGVGLFRILQEALTNVVRHAEARRVEIRLQQRDGVATLEVTDDGCGISEATTSGPLALGVVGMRERALALGGDFEIGALPGGGTRVAVRIRLRS